MSILIPESHHDLFTKPLVATLITVTPEGHPQGTVIWCRLNGSHVQIAIQNNTQKYRNLVANPQVSLVIVDTEDPYRYIEVRGTATISAENVSTIMKDIARKYLRPDFNISHGEDTRVIVTITPTKVNAHG